MDNMADNAYTAAYGTTEDVGAVEDTGVAAGGETSAAESAAQQDNNHGNDVTNTQAFAQRLRERTDQQISSVGMTNPYTGEPIRNVSDLRALQRMMDAEANGDDPQYAGHEARLREQLGEYQLREQESAILSNPELAPYYEEYHDDVLAIAEGARANGSDVDLELALRVVMANHYEDIRRQDAERIREEITNGYDGKMRASPGSIGGGGSSVAPDFAHMSSEEFERYVNDVKQLRRHVGQ